jgi:hypothetical protein
MKKYEIIAIVNSEYKICFNIECDNIEYYENTLITDGAKIIFNNKEKLDGNVAVEIEKIYATGEKEINYNITAKDFFVVSKHGKA